MNAISQRNQRKTRIGTVQSNKMDKTVVVGVERRIRHGLYEKYITRTTTLMAHDADNQCAEGDLVRIMEVRPLSRRKRWRVVEILKKAEQV